MERRTVVACRLHSTRSSLPVPTLTLSWLAARWFSLGQPYDPDLIEMEQVGPGQYKPRR